MVGEERSGWLTMRLKIESVIEMFGDIQLICVRRASSRGMLRTGIHLRIREDGLVLVNRFCQLGHMLVFVVSIHQEAYRRVEKR
jgi:hypothetical protein